MGIKSLNSEQIRLGKYLFDTFNNNPKAELNLTDVSQNLMFPEKRITKYLYTYFAGFFARKGSNIHFGTEFTIIDFEDHIKILERAAGGFRERL